MTKIDLDKELVDLFGKPIKMDGGSETMKVGMTLAHCLAGKKGESTAETIAEFSLANLLSTQKGEIELSPEETIRAQKAVQSSGFSNLVAGALLLYLEAK